MSTETDKTERFIVDGYVTRIYPKVARDGRPMWIINLDLLEEVDDSFDFEFVSYYKPTFFEDDRIRIGVSRRGDSTISSCAPFIVTEE